MQAHTGKSILSPPLEVKGMVILNKSLFKKTLSVVSLTVYGNVVSDIVKGLKQHMLCMRNLKNIIVDGVGKRCFFLNPEMYTTIVSARDALAKEKFTDKLEGAEYGMREVRIGYDNWSAEEILRAVLPEDIPNVTGFTIVGHVAHLNLKEAHSPYKSLIGQVLLDKHKNLLSVVNKTDSIVNTYRNFVMEVIAGKDDLRVTAKENGCCFRFDFSKVYWNSRLGTEHERIVSGITPETIVFDVFAGVGPFSVPAAKKGATVYCNDLNPDSYAALCDNLKSNKVKGAYQNYNMDGRMFISSIVKERILDRRKRIVDQPLVAIMNLPAIAIEFLDAFVGLFDDISALESPKSEGIKIICYCFSKETNCGEDVAARINSVLSYSSNRVTAQHCRKVRNVAPNKDMICAQFYIYWSTLTGGKNSVENDNAEPKKIKLDTS